MCYFDGEDFQKITTHNGGKTTIHVVYRQSLFFRENDVDENGIHVKESISSMTVGLLFFYHRVC